MRHRLTALYVCFFLSGAAALIYEIVWQRMLTLVFGVSTWSIAAVLTAYMAGLALGAWAFRRLADRVQRAARAYALVELGIAATAVGVSQCIDPLMDVYVRVAGAFPHSFYLTHLIRLALALAVFVAPCTLIGATVPLMGRLVTRLVGSLGVGFGRFYAVNTLGAVVGAALAGFFLIRLIGMNAAIFVAMGGNLVAGLIALIVGSRQTSGIEEAGLEGLRAERRGIKGLRDSGIKDPGDAVVDSPALNPSIPQSLNPLATDLGSSILASRGDTRVLYALAAIAGLTGLGYEVAWARLLAVYTLNSVYVFTMLLTAFLAALALGSALGAWMLKKGLKKGDITRFPERRKGDATLTAAPNGARKTSDVPFSATIVAVVQMALALTAPLVLAATHWIKSFGVEYQYRSAAAVFWMEYQAVLVVVFVPTVLLGMTLPLLAGLLPGGTASPGRSVGALYAWNSVGCIFGAALTGVALIPLLGLRATLMCFAAINFAAGCWIATRWRVSTAGISTAGIEGLRDSGIKGADTAPVSLPAPDAADTPSLNPVIPQSLNPFVRRALRFSIPQLIPIGAVLLVALSLLVPVGAQFIRPPADRGDGILYYEEGNSAIVHVTGTEIERLHRTLYLDSQSVAGDTESLITDQKMLAHLPLLLHPAPRRALTVGFGTGGTSYSMMLHEVETHCVEIEKAVPAAARYFLRQNHGIVNLSVGLDPARRDFRLILDDARSWLHLAPEPYDVIVDDLTSIQYRGNGNLYTRECFALIRRKLTPDGVGCAWVPITGIDVGPLRMLVRTFQAAFEHTSIWYMSNTVNDFVILVGTPERLMIDLDDWRRRMSEQWVAPDLAEVGLDDPFRLATCLLLDEGESKIFSGSGALHTDDRPLLDYLTHAGVYHDRLAENLRAMLASQRMTGGDVPVSVGGVTPVEVAKEWDIRRRATQFVLEGHAFKRQGDDESARALYVQASDMAPEDATFARLAGRRAHSENGP